jgi:hypothetical protein
MTRAYRYEWSSSPGGAIAALFVLGFLTAAIAAWVTHVVWIIAKLAGTSGATFGQAALGVIGAFMPPVGIIHGIMIWCGAGV